MRKWVYYLSVIKLCSWSSKSHVLYASSCLCIAADLAAQGTESLLDLKNFFKSPHVIKPAGEAQRYRCHECQHDVSPTLGECHPQTWRLRVTEITKLSEVFLHPNLQTEASAPLIPHASYLDRPPAGGGVPRHFVSTPPRPEEGSGRKRLFPR